MDSHDEHDLPESSDIVSAPDAADAVESDTPDGRHASEASDESEPVAASDAADAAEGAEVVDAQDATSSEAPGALDTSDTDVAQEASEAEAAIRLAPEQLKAIVEALIFASPEPLTPKVLSKLLADEPKDEVLAAVAALREKYEGGGGLHLVEVAGGFQITTRPELHEWVRRLFHERTTQKLSVQALETLAVIAYRQPITAAEVGEIRGVNTSGVLSTLLERHLVKIVGRKNVVGRPFLYGTTKEFLIRFGLKDLGDLPRVEDMAQALGFEAPAILTERPVTDDMLPLEEGDAPE